MEHIGIIGGTGPEGRGIALRLAAAGLTVGIGSRSRERAREVAESLTALLPAGSIEGSANRELCRASSMLFLAVPFEYAEATLIDLAGCLKPEQLVVDVTVPLDFRQGPRVREELGGRSGSERLAQTVAGHCRFAAAFKTLPAHLLEAADTPLDCDEFICADAAEDRVRLEKSVSSIPGVRWIDAGPLHHCRALESMTALIIGINRRYKVKHGRFRVLGLESLSG